MSISRAVDSAPDQTACLLRCQPDGSQPEPGDWRAALRDTCRASLNSSERRIQRCLQALARDCHS
ncbi:MAG: hypothetical protein LJE84_08975 [Gammaproteobacteria bacterium]|nr:hypothetical protein [Gammaproteobacteria bacterium]